jgi:iron uptake system component EfeO
VQATDSECKLSTTSAPSGTITFAVTNGGSKVTEFYLYREDGKRVVGEVENIGPGITRELVLKVEPGNYITACKPGMAGDGIRAPFSVSDSGDQQGFGGYDIQLVERANDNYQQYVEDQSEQLVAMTAKFVAAYKTGKDDEARALYPVARIHWERIETVAESFGDLDPKLDLREADLEPGQKWTGWHRLEKDLWPARAKNYKPLSTAQRVAYSDDLVQNTAILQKRVPNLDFSADEIANGSRGLRPARSPARRSTGRVPTCGTSRPISTVHWWPSRDSVRCSSSEIRRSRARSLRSLPPCRPCSTFTGRVMASRPTTS